MYNVEQTCEGVFAPSHKEPPINTRTLERQIEKRMKEVLEDPFFIDVTQHTALLCALAQLKLALALDENGREI